jgi:hypothetical protein
MIKWSIRQRCTGGYINCMLDLVVCRYPDGWGEDVSVLFHDFVHFLLLQRETLCRGHGFGGNPLLTVSMDHKEDELPGL